MRAAHGNVDIENALGLLVNLRIHWGGDSVEGPRTVATSIVSAKYGAEREDPAVCNDDCLSVGASDGGWLESAGTRTDGKGSGTYGGKFPGVSVPRDGWSGGTWWTSLAEPAADRKDGRASAGTDEEYRGACASKFVD